MEFIGDVLALGCPVSRKIDLLGATLPTSKDVYFRAKQKEIIDQYSAARIFMYETETTDWNHWFNPVEDETKQRYFELSFRGYLYETALTFYNIVVDLSWVLCYLATEFSIAQQNGRVEFGNIQPIEQAYELLRKAENLVTNPKAEENPFGYLQKICPKFSGAIDMVINFWAEFGHSNIRQRYNFCKHKGKPAYAEVEELTGFRLMGFYRQNQSGERIQLASAPKDVRLLCSLEESIEDLRKFDNEKLFPYISALFDELERVLNPSPFV